MINFKEKFYLRVYVISITISIILIFLVKTEPFSDFKYYFDLANQIKNGGSLGNTYTSIGYSIILGCIFKIFGGYLIIAKLFNLALFMISGILVYNIINYMNLKEIYNKILFVLFMVYPNNIIYVNIVSSEMLFTCLLLLIIYIYMSGFKHKYIIIGIITGVEITTKPFFILLPFVMIVHMILTKDNLKKSTNYFLQVLIISLLITLPLVIRNTIYNGKFTFVSNNGGIVLFINNNSENNLGRWMDINNVNNPLPNGDKYLNSSMTEKNTLLTAEAKKWIISHPKDFLVLGVKRLINTYFVPDDAMFLLKGTSLDFNILSFSDFFNKINENKSNVNFYIYCMYFLILSIIKVLFSLVSLIYIFKLTYENIKKIINRDTLDSLDIMFLGLFYMFTLVYFITEGQGRYSFPMNFIIITFAFRGYLWLFGKVCGLHNRT